MHRQMTYLDANVMVGTAEWLGEGFPTSPQALAEAMDHFGIHEALVRDAIGEAGNAAGANEHILEVTRDNPRLHPVWMLLPPYTRDLPPPQELVAQMREHAVAAAWLNYGALGLPLEEWVFGDMLEPLAEARVPVFLSPLGPREGQPTDVTDWSGVVRVCHAFPSLPVIATECRVSKGQRAMWAALAKCANLHIDISILWLSRAVDYLAREFGAARMVFGTQLPRRTPGAVRMQLDYADLTPEQLAQIAGDNMREMISWHGQYESRAADISFPRPLDALHQAARQRADLSGQTFYDCHGHVGRRNAGHVCVNDPGELVAEMDKLGVRQCCLFPLLCYGEDAWNNDLTFDAVQRFPDRFVGFTLLNPNHGVDTARAELERGLGRGMRGVKMLSGIHNPDHSHPVVKLACKFAHEHKLFALNHTWGPAEVLRRYIETYPNACYISGHSTTDYVELTRCFPNLYICTCPFLAWNQTEHYVERYGADRLLFGSDLQDLPIGWGMGPIFYARIPEADKRKILGQNLKKLLQVYGVPW